MGRCEKINPFFGWLKTAAVPSVLFLTMIFAAPQMAIADSIHGLLEYIYNNSTVKTTDISGVSSNIRNNGLQQRYTLAFDKTLYPSLLLSGGGLFEYAFQNGKTDDVDNRSTNSRLSPYVDLVMNNPFINAGIGYRRREDAASANGVDNPKQIQDLYSATFGWHPSELPSIDVYYMRRYFYDENKRTQNIQTDNITWTSNYTAIKGLEINYNGNYNLVQDKLNETETDNLTNSGRIAYSGDLLDKRIIYHTSYNASIQNTSITTNALTGGVFYQPTPTPGTQRFAVTPSGVNTVTNGALPVAAINFNPLNLLTLPADGNNMGLSFIINTQMDTIFLPVKSGSSSANLNYPGLNDLKTFFNDNSALFSFLVYTSLDGTNWGPATGITPLISVGANPSNPTSDEVGFIINFPLQNTSYIKVVQTPPLIAPTITNPPPSINPSNFFVVDIRAFSKIILTTKKTISSSTISGLYDMNVKALLLEDPNLSYDLTFTFTHNKSDQSPLTTTYLLNNGLNLFKRLGDIWSVNARLADEFNVDSDSRMRNTVTYNAGLSVTPLPTLSHSLVYGGRYELFEGESTLTNSIYLNNTAELYKGFSVNLGAGYNISQFPSGQSADNMVLTVGAEFVPHRNFTLSLAYQDNLSHQSGGGQPARSTFNRTASATATFRPFEAVYLTGGYSIFMQNDRRNVTLQNFGVSWSPFRGGDLQFNFAYSETYDSGQDAKERNISPTIRWNIRPGSTLDVSYNILDSTSGITGKTKANTLGAQLRITF